MFLSPAWSRRPLEDKPNGARLCFADLDEEVAVPSGTSAGRDGSDRPDGPHVEDGTTRHSGVSGAVPAEDGEDTLNTHLCSCDRNMSERSKAPPPRVPPPLLLFVPQVAKQWYDFERSSFVFVRKLREGQTFTFRHQHDFDENGIIYWVGTNAK